MGVEVRDVVPVDDKDDVVPDLRVFLQALCHGPGIDIIPVGEEEADAGFPALCRLRGDGLNAGPDLPTPMKARVAPGGCGKGFQMGPVDVLGIFGIGKGVEKAQDLLKAVELLLPERRVVIRIEEVRGLLFGQAQAPGKLCHGLSVGGHALSLGDLVDGRTVEASVVSELLNGEITLDAVLGQELSKGYHGVSSFCRFCGFY